MWMYEQAVALEPYLSDGPEVPMSQSVDLRVCLTVRVIPNRRPLGPVS